MVCYIIKPHLAGKYLHVKRKSLERMIRGFEASKFSKQRESSTAVHFSGGCPINITNNVKHLISIALSRIGCYWPNDTN